MSDPLRRDKQALRSEIAVRLNDIDRESAATAAAAVAAHAEKWRSFQNAEIVMAFMSMGGEIDTEPLILAAQAAGKAVAVPRVVPGPRRKMEAVLLENFSESMTLSRIGVREPTEGVVLDPSRIDLVFVPGVAFGPVGSRLGHGWGYYDRFLSGPAAGALRCGLCYEVQIVEHLPVEQHDVSMQYLLTESSLREVAAG